MAMEANAVAPDVEFIVEAGRGHHTHLILRTIRETAANLLHNEVRRFNLREFSPVEARALQEVVRGSHFRGGV
jgi:hypothetical protein